ncbi:laccase [Mollisia scopiformis]|uniref:laccase n=1 Tax=Mollisia scopiformis TaxID=149040 RepID=A0A194XB10_MOLSC|nr:laccase [Mollisia scopiformis]KUJ17361.1 laccase [Mollisia scopiformis]
MWTMFFSSLFLAASALSTAFAAPASTSNQLSKRCTNSATDRSCWGDYDLSTNYYETVPDTGVTREYWFDIQNGTASPDGYERLVLTVNGSFPGPTIIAGWGDTVVVHVTNSMENNGTSIHSHGIRQNYTNQMDGVASITQSWDGILGGIIINGPATANYDVDLGNLLLNDWSHQTADQLNAIAGTSGPHTFDNCLINSTNTYNDSGSRFETTFASGTSYRLRLVNGAADTHFKFSIDNHTMTVISTNFVPIVPYNTTMLSIGMGERYDVIVTADQAVSNYWMRAIPQETCSDNDNVDNILGIVRYDSSSTADPSSTGYDYEDSCDDEDISTLVPYLSYQVGTSASVTDDFIGTLTGGAGAIKWEMGSTSFVSQWDYPTVLQVAEGNDTWSAEQSAIELPTADQWVYFIIETTFAQAHPIHLHGHDFWVLAQGTGTYDADTVTLTTTDSPRRDVAMLPGTGYLVLAYITDNPGAWLMHCHIAWHTSEGFALQLLERESEMVALMDVATVNSTCANWDTYATEDDIVQDDAGV